MCVCIHMCVCMHMRTIYPQQPKKCAPAFHPGANPNKPPPKDKTHAPFSKKVTKKVPCDTTATVR